MCRKVPVTVKALCKRPMCVTLSNLNLVWGAEGKPGGWQKCAVRWWGQPPWLQNPPVQTLLMWKGSRRLLLVWQSCVAKKGTFVSWHNRSLKYFESILRRSNSSRLQNSYLIKISHNVIFTSSGTHCFSKPRSWSCFYLGDLPDRPWAEKATLLLPFSWEARDHITSYREI